MKIGFLLKELIIIAKKQKTDFALYMNMTPSGLSKILSEKGFPVMKERKIFTKQASDYFAEAIYAPGCYWKFENIFPVIYDFESKDDLQSFLSYAIEYALDNTFTEENNINLDYSERGYFYLGRRPVISLLCITLSNFIVNNLNEPLEIYFSAPLSDSSYYRLFQKIKFVGYAKFKNITLNYFFNKEILNDSNKIYLNDLILLISKLQKYFRINLWESISSTSYFLFLKGYILLTFDLQINGTPVLIPIHHKSYLAIFYNSLIQREIKKISYSREEIIHLLEENPERFNNLLEQGVDSVFNFVSIGYLLNKKELDAATNNSLVSETIWKLFFSILSEKTIFAVSIAAMEKFVSFGKVIAPLIGPVYFPSNERISYLQRLDSYLSNGNHSKIKIINSDLSNIAMFCFQDFSIVYMINDTYENEIFHVFRTDKIKTLFYDEYIKDDKVSSVDFSEDLWKAYQKGLINIDLS